jgi:hypothetical protein
MKRLLLMFVVVLMVATTALASIGVGDRLTYGGQTSGKSYGNGGEFTWSHTINTTYPGAFTAAPTSSTVFTFCAETTQTIATPVYVTNLAQTNSTGQYTLHDFGQWLFFRYANGGNAAVPTHAGLNNNWAGAIQWSLWNDMGYSQQFTNPISGQDATFHTAYAADTAWQNRDKSKTYVDVAWLSSSYADVPQAANNYKIGTGNAQDQIIFVSAGGLSEVPEPASIIVWSLLGLSATGIAAVRRRRNLGQCGWSEENRQAISSIIERGRCS